MSSVNRQSSIALAVSCKLVVSVPSGFRTVVILLYYLVLPAASLCTCDRGFTEAAKLQYSFQEVDFAFFISASHVLLASIYASFLLSLSSSSFLVLWYSLLLAFTFFLIAVSRVVQHGAGFFLLLFIGFGCRKVLLQAEIMASSINSILCSISTSLPIASDR